ncbi:MAG: PqqD family protein [Lachnospiraceae bacterium]
MRMNQEFILRNIAGDCIVVPTGNASKDFNGLITLNEVAFFIWTHVNQVKDRDEMVKLLLDEYEVSEETARRDVNGFLDMLKSQGILIEE